jgi:hypothetical protein
MNKCSTCNHWQRDGGDGICRGGNAPNVKIAEEGVRLQLVWPRTNADERCRDYETYTLVEAKKADEG